MRQLPVRRLAMPLLAIGLGLMPPAGGAAAAGLVETFDAARPAAEVLGGLASVGDDGTWRAALEDGAYVWRNEADAQAVKYIHLDRLSGGADLATAAVEVDVTVAAGEGAAGAGLIYRFDPAGRTYLLFVLLREGDYGLFFRAKDGFKRLASGDAPGVDPAGRNRLGVRPMGERIEFLVNGNRAVAIGGDRIPGEGVGIAALGKGTFSFDNLSIDPAG
jgi:hypothetical protein